MNQPKPPVILQEGKYTEAQLKQLQTRPIWKTLDIYQSQLAELFEIDNPGLIHAPDFKKQQQSYVQTSAGKTPQLKGSWVYFSWSGLLIHMLGDKNYRRLRTNRNHNLITASEQAQLAKFTVGVTGLSVGGGIAVSLAYSGIGDVMKLADHDVLETANLNRLRSGLQYLSQPKLSVAAQQIYEINPFATVLGYPGGLTSDNLDSFLGGKQPLDVVFDEIDDFEMKIRLRLAAKKAKVPVIMLTSLGDNILVDIERYDSEPKTKIFNGLLGDLPLQILKGQIGEKEKIKYAMQIVGAQYVPTRALQSLAQINRTLVGRPQLFSTIAVDGGLAAYLVKRLALNWPLPSGRSYISFEEALSLPKLPDDGRSAILEQLRKLTS